MSDLIKREDAIRQMALMLEDISEDLAQDILDRFGHDTAEEFATEAMSIIPSADRPRGEWIDMGDFEQCSVCKGTRLKEFQSYYGKTTWVKTPYCPNCGADMRGADK